MGGGNFAHNEHKVSTVLFQRLQYAAQTQRHLLIQKQTEMPPSVDHPAGGQNIWSDIGDTGVLIFPL